MEISKMTVTIQLGIDEKTALTCLKIVELYANQTGVDVIGHRNADGSLVFDFAFAAQKPDADTE